MDVVDETANMTMVTTASSNDESMLNPEPPAELYEDRGLLHMVGVSRDDELERDIEEKTRYELRYHKMPKTDLEGDALLKQLFPAGFPFLTESLKDKKLEIKYKAPAKFEMLGECGEVQYVVLPDFLMGTKLLQQLQAMSIRVISPVFIRQCLTINQAISTEYRSIDKNNTFGKRHPLFSRMMTGLTVCFTNFPYKEDLHKMKWMVHVMGGRVSREYNPSVDNLILIADSAGREKFETAMTLGNPVLKRAWLDDCYKLRQDPTALPRLMYAEDNLRYSCPIFYRFKFFLVGFKHDDEVDIDENCKHYGASVVKELDQMRKCSHIIVPNLCELDAYEPYIADMKRIRSKTETNIVNDKWFYESVSLGNCLSVNGYLVGISDNGLLDFSYYKDRKRRQYGDGLDGRPHKKRSSEANCSVYGNISITNLVTGTPKPSPKAVSKIVSKAVVDKREMIISEFIRTEETYVRHLKVIEERYYQYLHQQVTNPPANNKFELTLYNVHNMFHKIPPIRIVHEALLKELERYEVSEKQRKDIKKKSIDEESFGKILLNWIGKNMILDENAPTGRSHVNFTTGEMRQKFQYEKDETKKLQRFDKDICAKEGEKKNASGQYEGGTLRKKPSGENDEADPDVLKHYSIYMNSHENIVELINHAEKNCFRFRSYMRTEGSRKENDRLSIRDLMIEPVQRLPRIILLLDAIIKKTNKQHGDLELLEIVQKEFKKVTACVNDSKKRFDQKKDFVNFLMQISSLPSGIISTSKHNMIEQYQFKLYKELDNLPAETDVFLWLFELDVGECCYNEENDSVLEIAYVPHKKTGSISSGTAERSLRSVSKMPCYKHIVHIPLRTVVHVCEVYNQMDFIGVVIEYRKETNSKEHEKVQIVLSLVQDADYGGVSNAEWRNTLVEHVNKSRVKFNRPTIAKGEEIDVITLNKKNFGKDSRKPSFLGKVARALTLRERSKSQPGALQKAQSLANLTPNKRAESKVRLMRDSH